MTVEQMAWLLYLWFLGPAVIELLLIMALIGIATMPAENFKSKRRLMLIVTGSIVLVPLLLYLSTLVLGRQLNQFVNATFGEAKVEDGVPSRQ